MLTEAGKAKIVEVWADHKVGIQKCFGQYLDTDDAECLLAATAKVLRHDAPVPLDIKTGDPETQLGP